MYGRLIRFVNNISVQRSIVGLRVYPSFFTSSVSTQSNYKNRNLVDEFRESASGMPPTPSSGVSTQSNYKSRNLVDDIRESASGMPPTPSSGADDRVNVVKTSTTPPTSTTTSTTPPSMSSTYDRREDDRNPTTFVADVAKQGVVKAMETGLNIGEMAKQTLDNVWDATKDTTHKVKATVAGDEDKKYDVPPTDHFVDDLRKHADGYDQRSKREGSGIYNK